MIADGDWELVETGSCVATVNFVEGREIEKARWFDIGAAAVAVERMCIRNGNAGIAFGLGTCSSFLMLFLHSYFPRTPFEFS